MSTERGPVVVEIAGHTTEAQVVDRDWQPDYSNPCEDVLVDVDGSEWWVTPEDVQARDGCL